MAPGSWPEASGSRDAERLRGVARASIEHGLDHGTALPVRLDEHPPALHEPGASFVTLRLDGDLRGCTGSLEPVDPLVVDVARNAWRSAFADPRFAPLSRDELPEVAIEISLLSPLEPIAVASEDELLARLRPGVDGLVLRDGTARATFLPAVWESLPDPRHFVAELKRKAGLAADHWSSGIRFQRYTVEER